MTSTGWIVTSAGAGCFVGAALSLYSRYLLMSTPRFLAVGQLVVVVLTAASFGMLAWRFGRALHLLLPYGLVAAVGLSLSMIDVFEQRLPNVLVYPSLVATLGLIATSTLFDSRGLEFLRALAGLVVVSGLYLVLALVSRGGLGGGDVKLGALLGATLAWWSWPALVGATFIAWLSAALMWLLFRLTRGAVPAPALPMGPFLVFGALVIVVFPPA